MRNIDTLPSAPIGIFDSGVGGLSIAKSIRTILPNENLIYVADSLYAPYGDKSLDFIHKRSKQVIEFLLSHRVKLIVVACNTVTVSSIEQFRQSYSIPFVGVEPGIKPAANDTKTGTIGVLATRRTIESSQYSHLVDKFASQYKVISQACIGLVEMIEKLELDSDQTHQLLQRYLKPIIEYGADKVVLGCTHYSFVKDEITNILQNRADIIDTSEAVAQQLARQLSLLSLNNASQTAGSEQFFSSDCLTSFVGLLNRLWKQGSTAKLFSADHSLG